jgi:hypothetical protein
MDYYSFVFFTLFEVVQETVFVESVFFGVTFFEVFTFGFATLEEVFRAGFFSAVSVISLCARSFNVVVVSL